MRKTFFVIPAMLATILAPSISRGAPVEVMCLGQVATIVGTPGEDDLTGTAGNDVIAGLRGNDWIEGLEGDDLICGNANWGDGSGERERLDRLLGGPGDDRISGGWGVDYIQGGEGDDLILGGRGNDVEDWVAYVQGSLNGGPGADVIRGGPGDDHLNGGGSGLSGWDGSGADFLYGGTGDDRLPDNYYRFLGDIFESQAPDVANDSLFGGPGGDTLLTSGGDDYQYGGSGDDALGYTEFQPHGREVTREEDFGNDTYDGGSGVDSVMAGRASTTPVLFDLSAGRASSDSLGEDTLLNLEIVYGSPHDDTIIGDDGPNWLIGGPYWRRPEGNDRLVGLGGDDVLDAFDNSVGTDHYDSVDAGEGNDSCPADADDELVSCEL